MKFLFLFLFGFLFLPVSTQAVTCPVSVDAAYKTPQSSAVYYVDVDCKKRPFKNSAIFATYFDSSQKVTTISAELLNLVPPHELGFMPLGPLYNPKYGALVKTVTDSKVYFLLNEKKYWVTSEAVFNALRYDWKWIEDIDSRLLDKYMVGGEITDTTRHLDGTIVKYSGSPQVYVLENGKKRHIANEQMFNALGYRWDRIVVIADTEVYADVEDVVAPLDNDNRIILRAK